MIGIYQIRNIKNNKKYIGKSITSIEKRWQSHRINLNYNTHNNNLLQNDWNKYGCENFEFSVIEKVKNINNINILELNYISKLNPNYDYNIIGLRSKKTNMKIFNTSNNIKIYQKLLHTRYEYGNMDINLFKKWVDKRRIIKSTHSTNWQDITNFYIKTGLYKNNNDMPAFKDHISIWIDDFGNSIVVSHPYVYFPGDTINSINSIEELTKNYYEKLEIFSKWCEENDLLFYIYSSKESWYYPNASIMLELMLNK